MVEKFNFYDIYGYLLPGLMLVGLLWTPFGLFWRAWPQQEISSAILLFLLAYIAGHFIQGFAFVIIPSKTNKFGASREFSDLLLDNDDLTLAQQTKYRINELSKKHFGLDLETGADSKVAQNSISRRRSSAFFQARSALLKYKGERASYWEQFEGLYALMRGATMAAAAATFYFLGWAIALLDHHAGLGWTKVFLLIFGVAALAFALAQEVPKKVPPATPEQCVEFLLAQKNLKEKNRDWSKMFTRGTAISLCLLLFGSAMLVARNAVEHDQKAAGERHPISICCLWPAWTGAAEGKDSTKPEEAFINAGDRGFIMLLLTLATAVVSLRCHGAYKFFAREFALAVWRDFANFETTATKTG